ncbi:YaiI/YqxD family protein [Pleionea sediminis]|uniref:YaiI/YqxD family protein n=1 Tax=Pleionea sediminis TaxID=2569479 RepID=UPI001FEC0CF0|nr:YaiI/YqxD family protein [Pleionea sediminis]
MSEKRNAMIWVDADACPKVVRDILFKAANRTQTMTRLLANQMIATPSGDLITCIQVEQGYDVADNEIVRRCEKGDLVITQDIPLASEVIDKGAVALSPRGQLFTRENIKSRLNMRDFMDTLRGSGIHTGGAKPLGDKDKMAFANQLDRWLAKNAKPGK